MKLIYTLTWQGAYTIKLEMRIHIQFMLSHRTCGFCLSRFFSCLLAFKHSLKPFPVLVCHTEVVLSERVLSLY